MTDVSLGVASSVIALTVFGGVAGPAVLSTGGAVDIALARPIDLERVRHFYQGMSDATTYYRFFGIRRALPDAELSAVVTQRLPDHVTLLASVGRHLIGVGQFVPGDTPGDVEVAFAVADDHHREGVATLLLERLAIIAERCGIERLTAVVLPGNSDMQLVFRTVGLPTHNHFESQDGTIHVSLDLAGIGEMKRQEAMRQLSAMHDQRCQSVNR